MSVEVVVDDREPRTVVAALRSHPEVAAVTVRRLDAGDIAIGDVGIERKTVADYLGSALGRTGTDLEAQVAAMTDAYAHGYVLIEGDLAELEAHWPGVDATAVRGTMASITARSGVPVIPCVDRDRLVDLAVRLARKHVEEPAPRPLAPSTVPGRSAPPAMRMYGCIDGIGPGTAAALYEAYPTIESVIAASKDDLQAVEGVGPVRAEAIYAAFHQPE